MTSSALSGNIPGAGDAGSIFVIAEVGINHNGDMDIARRLIDAAVEAGCDAVKFQKRDIETVYSAEVLAQPRKSPWGETQRAQKEGLEFGKAEYDAIDAYCRHKGIPWFASAWDLHSQAFLAQYDLFANKVASAMLTHIPLLQTIAAEKKPTFISTGLSTLEDIDRAVALFQKADCPFVLMHSISTYPADDKDLNLLMIRTLKARYGAPVGYSGHERGLEPTFAAAVLGAAALERHITLDRTMYGSDQAASLEPKELAALVRLIRDFPSWLGDGVKKLAPGEAEVAAKLRYW